ncbi:MAG: hypothetical protein ACRDI2_05010, partial [Chloroflexota bacterium]
MQTTSQRIGLTVAPDHLQLPPGGRAELTLAVTNQGQVVDTFRLTVEGIDPAWVTVGTPTISLFPDNSGPLGLELHLPDGQDGQDGRVGPDGPEGHATAVAPAGTYAVRLTVRSQDDPAEAVTAELTLEVLPVGLLEVTLAPQRVTAAGPGGRGQFRLQLANPGNAERLLDLAVTDDEAALETRFEADRVPVLPGETREVALTIRPRKRPWVAAPQHYRFTATATPSDAATAEPLAMAYGELIYRAPLAFLAGIPPRFRRLLL